MVYNVLIISLILGFFWFERIYAMNLPSSQYQALYSFYNSTNGEGWNWKLPYSTMGYPWSFTSGTINSDPCSSNYPWQGVYCSSVCTSKSCSVIEISLERYNLIGTIPSSIAQLTKLTTLSLSYNHLIGTIPNEISTLTSMTSIYLDNNQFRGTIPTNITHLTQLQYLEVSVNMLFGSIPSNIGKLTNLIFLDLQQNELTGPIPISFYQLHKLEYISFGYNYFTGTLSNGYQNMTKLIDIYNYGNLFSGTIPVEFGQMSNLFYLDLSANLLVGNIPSFDALPHIAGLYLADNYLTGTMPATIGTIQRLKVLDLSYNLLTGTIPTLFGQLTVLYDITLQYNYFSGSMLDILVNANLQNLQYLYLFTNLFSGNIPSNISHLSSLLIWDMDVNCLSGNIPMGISNLTSLTTIYFSSNYLTGTIPSNLGHMASLLYIYLDHNLLIGSLPSSLSLIKSLTGIFFSYNQLTGTIPNSFQNITTMQTVYLDSNKFVGSIPSFDSSPHITAYFIQNNSFTGSIPEQLTSKGSLISLSVSINCLTGTLSDSLCSNNNLTQLIFDGLHSSSSCINHIFPGSDSYFQINGVRGTIPSCLFSLPHLSFLHLSGNNLEGTLPDFYFHQNNRTLVSLNLANNRLTGSIPAYLLSTSNLFNLDLSFNQFSFFGIDIQDIQPFPGDHPLLNYSILIAELNSTFIFDNSNIQPSLRLQVNHLSGNIPKDWLSISNTTDVDILEGNLFDCLLDRSDLPSQDPKVLSYDCGSDKTNQSVYIFLVIFLVFVVCLLSCYHWKTISLWLQFLKSFGCKELIQEIHSYSLLNINNSEKQLNDNNIENQHSEENQPSSPSSSLLLHIQAMALTCDKLRRFLQWFLIWLMIFIIPMYISLTFTYRTYHHTYIWIVSSAYLSGLTPALILFCCLFLTMTWFVFTQISNVLISLQFHCSKTMFQNLITLKNWNQQLKTFCFILINMIVVIVSNVLYVIAYNRNYSSTTLIFISLALSFLKFFWGNLFLLGKGRKWLESYLMIHINSQVILMLTIFNNLFVPYLAEGFASPNCFLYMIENPPAIQSISTSCFIADECLNEGEACAIDTYCTCTPYDYIPPYHYNYTCSSSLLTTFAYVFIYRYILSVFILPLIWWIIKYNQQHFQMIFISIELSWWNQNYFHFTKEKWFLFWNKLLSPLMKFDYFFLSQNTHHHQQSINSCQNNPESWDYEFMIKSLDNTLLALFRDVSIGEKSANSIVLDLTMLLSFGILFPPLGCIIFLSLIKDIMLLQWLLQQYLQASIICSQYLQQNHIHSNEILIIQTKLQEILQQLNTQFILWQTLFQQGIWWTALVAGWFWSFTLFDTLGSKYGVLHSIWIAILMGMSSSLNLWIKYLWMKIWYVEIKTTKSIKDELEFVVQMNPISQQKQQEEVSQQSNIELSL